MAYRTIGLLALAACLSAQLSAYNYTLITEPDQGLAPIYNLIGSAKRTLDMTMYELVDTQAEQLLAQAAASGVTVRVILDQNPEKKSNTTAYNFLNSLGVAVHWAWGTGFGPTIPEAPVGVEVPPGATYSTASAVSVTVGNTSATVYGAALAPGFAALYQVAIQVPPSLADWDYAVVATVSGIESPPDVLLTVMK